MAVEKKEIEYAKELGDVMVLVVELVKDIKAGKDVGAITSENLPHLINAIQGADQIPAEAKASREVALQTMGLHTGELAGVLIS